MGNLLERGRLHKVDKVLLGGQGGVVGRPPAGQTAMGRGLGGKMQKLASAVLAPAVLLFYMSVSSFQMSRNRLKEKGRRVEVAVGRGCSHEVPRYLVTLEVEECSTILFLRNHDHLVTQ